MAEHVLITPLWLPTYINTLCTRAAEVCSPSFKSGERNPGARRVRSVPERQVKLSLRKTRPQVSSLGKGKNTFQENFLSYLFSGVGEWRSRALQLSCTYGKKGRKDIKIRGEINRKKIVIYERANACFVEGILGVGVSKKMTLGESTPLETCFSSRTVCSLRRLNLLCGCAEF